MQTDMRGGLSSCFLLENHGNLHCPMRYALVMAHAAGSQASNPELPFLLISSPFKDAHDLVHKIYELTELGPSR